MLKARCVIRIAVLCGVYALASSGCVFRKLEQQQQQLDQLCLISGTIASDAGPDDPRVVVLLRQTPAATPAWQLASHFVSEVDGRWLMVASPGSYALAAFADRSRDLMYQPGEPLLNADDAPHVDCGVGSRLGNFDLRIPATGGRAYTRVVDLESLHARAPADQLAVSISALTMVGVVTTLDDPRFSDDNVKAGMWAPYDFLLKAGPGIYFLEAYDPARTPVLFVHGIDGSPQNFRYFIEHLDRGRFQPWVYYYPSGARLSVVAQHLAQAMANIEVRYRVPRLILVAHSMGGLVARGFLMQRQADRIDIPLFVTLSTPWGGHDAAQIGLTLAPTPVRSWYDMAPGSDYLQSLFYASPHRRRTLPAGTRYELMFSFNKGSSSFGASGDDVVTLASELRAEAQQEASGMLGFDATHMGILQDPAAMQRFEALLSDLPHHPATGAK